MQLPLPPPPSLFLPLSPSPLSLPPSPPPHLPPPPHAPPPALPPAPPSPPPPPGTIDLRSPPLGAYCFQHSQSPTHSSWISSWNHHDAASDMPPPPLPSTHLPIPSPTTQPAIPLSSCIATHLHPINLTVSLPLRHCLPSVYLIPPNTLPSSIHLTYLHYHFYSTFSYIISSTSLPLLFH